MICQTQSSAWRVYDEYARKGWIEDLNSVHLNEHVAGLVEVLHQQLPFVSRRLLDVGIGAGHTSAAINALEAFRENRFDVTGVDLSLHSLKLARQNGVSDKLSRVNLDHGRLPFMDNSFDLVVCAETLFYLTNTCEMIREMLRVCEPGGVILFSMAGQFEYPGSLGVLDDDELPPELPEGSQLPCIFSPYLPDIVDFVEKHRPGGHMRLVDHYRLKPYYDREAEPFADLFCVEKGQTVNPPFTPRSVPEDFPEVMRQRSRRKVCVAELGSYFRSLGL